MIIGIFTIHFLIVFIIPQSWKSIHPLLEKKQAVVFSKTSRRFQQNNTSFSVKQHGVFSKTTRHFQQNNTLFSVKQHVVFSKTTRCFQQNNTSFSVKQAVDREERSRNSLQKVGRQKK